VKAEELAIFIDHTLLSPEATGDQIDRLCDESIKFGFANVCANPVYVQRAAGRLSAARIDERTTRRPGVVSVAGFPLGASTTGIKVEEARRAMGDGATEIDAVIHVGSLIDGHHKEVRHEIEQLAAVVHRATPSGLLKIILETAALTETQIRVGCRLCAEGEADFIKTSTGLHRAGGATVEHVRLLHRTATPIRIKAAGGIRTAAGAIEMIKAGAARIGTSSGVAMMQELAGECG